MNSRPAPGSIFTSVFWTYLAQAWGMNASGFHSRKPPASTENLWPHRADLPDLVRKTREELGMLSARQAPCPTVTTLSI